MFVVGCRFAQLEALPEGLRDATSVFAAAVLSWPHRNARYFIAFMTPCDHLTPGTWPFEVTLVIDQELSFIDALVRCKRCDASYLLERLDQRGSQGLFRVSMPEGQASERVLYDLSRGSCDLNRAGAEVASLKNQAPFLPLLLLLDLRQPVIVSVIDSSSVRLPGDSARSLPCDGSWFERLGVEAQAEARL